MRCAVINESNIVTNVIEIDNPEDYPSYTCIQTDTAGIGWLYDVVSKKFAAPGGGPEGLRRIPKTDFKMRIPVSKYAAMRSLTQSDDAVWAFMEVLNDPTLTEVDLDSKYLSDAIDYLMGKYPNIAKKEDKDKWLA